MASMSLVVSQKQQQQDSARGDLVEWTPYKAILHDLYLGQNNTYTFVRDHMSKHYSFDKSVQQYQRIFKKWGFKKYLSTTEYEDINNILKRKHLSAGDANASIGDKFLSNKRLKKEIARRFPVTLANKWLARPQSPSSPATDSDAITARSTQNVAQIMVRPSLNIKFSLRNIGSSPWIEFVRLSKEPSAMLLKDSAQGGVFSTESSHHTIGASNRGLLFHTISQDCLNLDNSSIDSSGIELRKAPLSMFATKLRGVLPETKAFAMKLPCNSAAVFSSSDQNGPTKPSEACMTHAALYLLSNNLSELASDVGLTYEDPEKKFDMLLPLLRESSLLRSLLTTKALLQRLLKIACNTWNLRLLQKLKLLHMDMDILLPGEAQAMTPVQSVVHSIVKYSGSPSRLPIDFLRLLIDAGASPNKSGCNFISKHHDDTCHQGYCCCMSLPLGMCTKAPSLGSNILIASELVRTLIDADAHVCHKLSLTRLVEIGLNSQCLMNCLGESVSAWEAQVTGHYFWNPVQAVLARIQSSPVTERGGAWRCEDTELVDLLIDIGPWSDEVPEGLAHSLRKGNATIKRHDLFLSRWQSSLALALYTNTNLAARLLELGAKPNGCYFDAVDCIVLPDWEDTSQTMRSMDQWISNMEEEIYWLPEYRIHLTPLQAAVASRDSRAVQMVIDAGADIRCCHGVPPLVIAAANNDATITRMLLEFQIEIDLNSLSCDIRLWHLSPLAEASARGYVEVMKILICAGANLNDCHEQIGFTPLQAAIICKESRSVELLLSCEKVDISHAGSKMGVDGFTAAILLNDFALLMKLAQRLPDSSLLTNRTKERIFSAAITARDHRFRELVCGLGAIPSIHSAIEFLNLNNSMNALVETGFNLQQRMGQHSAADILFAHAIETYKTTLAWQILDLFQIGKEMTSSLLRYCVSEHFISTMPVRSAERSVGIALDKIMEVLLASQNWLLGQEDQCLLGPFLQSGLMTPWLGTMIDQLLQLGIDLACVDKSSGLTPLQVALDRGHLGAAKSLLDHGAPPNASPDQVFSKKTLAPLQKACEAYSVDLARLLITHGADPNATPSVSKRSESSDRQAAVDEHEPMLTALEIACGARLYLPCVGSLDSSRLEMIRILLSAGADPNLAEVLGREPVLTHASRHLSVDIVCELLAAGAHIDPPASSEAFGQTPLQAASARGDLDIVTLLINKGANVNASAGPNRGVTALQAAAAGGYIKIVQILLGVGADIAAPASPNEGRTAIDGAAEHGRLDIVKFLLDEYQGTEPLAEVCQRAARFAIKEGHMVVHELLTTYKRPADHVKPQLEKESREWTDRDFEEIL